MIPYTVRIVQATQKAVKFFHGDDGDHTDREPLPALCPVVSTAVRTHIASVSRLDNNLSR